MKVFITYFAKNYSEDFNKERVSFLASYKISNKLHSKKEESLTLVD